MKVLNRHKKNILTNDALGVTTEQLTVLKVLLKSLGSVYRFEGVPNITRRNDVAEHSMELLKMADFVAESLQDKVDQQKLRLLALVHDMGEIAGELTVVHDDLNGDVTISPRKKEILEYEIFRAFYFTALHHLNNNTAHQFLEIVHDCRNYSDLEDLKNKVRQLDFDYSFSDPKHDNIMKTFQGRNMNKMIPVLLKGMDRAEGTNYFCKYAEDIDLTDKLFSQKAVEYNMVSIYKSLPKNLGGSRDFAIAFEKVKTIVKAAVRRYKHLCRYDKLSFIDVSVGSVNDLIGRYVTWGPDNLVYYIKYWTVSDLFKVITGQFKLYSNLEDIYNAK